MPQITGSVSGKTSKTSDQDGTDSYSYGVSAEQLLFDGSKTSHNIKAAEENIKAAQYNYETTSSNIRLNLRTAFAALLRARKLVNITEAIAKRRKQNVELVKLRYEAGREHKGSFMMAEANSAQAEFEVKQAERNISLAQRHLTGELGRTKFTPFSVEGDFKILNTEREKPYFQKLTESNPLLQKLIVMKEAVKFGLKSAGADCYPQVYLNASAGKTDPDIPPETGAWSAGISVSIPIFEGGSRKAEVTKAKAALREAAANERSCRDSVISTLEETWTNFQDAIDKVEVQKKFLAAAEDRAKITQAQYSTGLISFDNWTIIEDDLVKAKKTFLEAQANALTAEADWIQAKGETLDDD